MKLVAISAAVLASGISLMLSSPSAQATAAQSKSTESVVVSPGDTLSKIANAKDTTYLRMFYANKKIENPNLIYPGQKLRVPKASEKLQERPLPANVVAPVETRPTTAKPVVPVTQPKEAPRQVTQAAPVLRQQTSTPKVSTSNAGIWDQLAMCESGGDWAINTGNGFYGGLQFSLQSWQAVGGSGMPNQASREEQIARATQLQAIQGWGAWPACAAKLGLL